MKALEGIGQRPGCGSKIFKGVVFGIVLIAFRYEVILLFRLLLAFPARLRGEPATGLPPSEVLTPALLYLAAVLLGVIGMIALTAVLVSRSILPARTPDERSKIRRHFLRSLFGGKPLLVRVKEGVVIGEPAEYPEETLKKIHGGSALLIDLNSAVVLEGSAAQLPLASARQPQAASQRYPMSRVGRPGLVFVRSGERLRGAVSLRRQFRIKTEVLSRTSDGIQLRCHVISLFSLGQPPAIYKVAYCGSQDASSLRVLQINPTTHRIQTITDDLDEADKTEIHGFAQNFIGVWEPLARLETNDASSEWPPYFISDQRIFSAVYSQARQVKEGSLDTWADLPTQVAAEIFRNMISTASYDALYGLEPGSPYALLNEFKPAFGRRMRLLGVASYQFVHPINGACPVVGQRVGKNDFYIAAPQDLRASKVLRDAGIKVITASFTELTPTDPKIKEQRLDMWRARWQREANLITAESERDIEHIRSQARAEKQREVIANLMEITKNTTFSEEALLLRLFQTMEDMIVDSSNQKLISQDTLRFLQTMGATLLPDSRSRLTIPAAKPASQLPDLDENNPAD